MNVQNLHWEQNFFGVSALEGLDSIVEFIENSFKQAKDLYNYLNSQEDFYCPYEPESNILCFQYKPDKINDQKQLELDMN